MIAITTPIDVGEIYNVEIVCEELDTSQIRQYRIVDRLGDQLNVIDEFGALLQFDVDEWLTMHPTKV
jgi:hypothetical protein